LLADALGFACRFSEAIQTAEETLARFPRDLPPEAWVMGIHPHAVASFWLGWSLCWAGRLREGFEAFRLCRRIGEEYGAPEVAAYASYWSAEVYAYAGDAERAFASARLGEEMSRRLGEPPALVAGTHLAFGYAHLAAGRAADAIEPARASLEGHRHANKANAGMSAALLAEALLESGDLAAAHATAAEAIALCRREPRPGYEIAAHGVLARALLRRDGAAARDAAEAALAEAAALIERTGAKLLAPALCTWRAELAAVLGDDAARERLLRESQRGYLEIGAPLQAERIARELAS
jgi:tetratricopeptide (TPR) repeat protein